MREHLPEARRRERRGGGAAGRAARAIPYLRDIRAADARVQGARTAAPRDQAAEEPLGLHERSNVEFESVEGHGLEETGYRGHGR